jgi:predicted XRE-type DNA-binding protein
MKQNIEYEPGSGNIFMDLGIENSDEYLKKAKVASTIYNIIRKRNLNQTEAGKILGISQPKVSALKNGRLDGFSMDRLLGFLTKLDQDVEIIVRPKIKEHPLFTLSLV